MVKILSRPISCCAQEGGGRKHKNIKKEAKGATPRNTDWESEGPVYLAKMVEEARRSAAMDGARHQGREDNDDRQTIGQR
jgi:hypothetical protein